MAKCRYCRRKGLFLSVDSNGLCGQCRDAVLLSITSHVRVIQESIKIAETTKKFDTKIGRLETIIAMADRLMEYHQKGIPTVSPSPPELAAKTQRILNDVVLERAQEIIDKAVDRSQTAATPTGRLSAISKAQAEIRDLARQYPTNGLQKKEEALSAARLAVEVHNHIEAAKKAEFKKQHRKALDAYREALYILTEGGHRDDAATRDVRSAITRLESQTG